MNSNWTEKQKKIFEGLSAIGLEIAGFFKAGLKFYYEDFPNGAYFLMHAAREIDGGLRDILAVDYIPDEDTTSIHKFSILSSLGSEDLNELAENWHNATKDLHKYVHRSGAWRDPRSLEKVKPIWDKYEKVLERLVGSYFAIIERIERIGEIQNIQGKVVETLCNILEVPTYYNYFFRNEQSPKWFVPLKEKGYFLPNKIKFDEQNNAIFWNILVYLERVSEQLKENPEYGEELITVINDIVNYSENVKRIINDSIWWSCVKIINNIPNEILIEKLTVEQFYIWLKVWTETSSGHDVIVSEIGTKLLPKFLYDDAGTNYAEAIVDEITKIRISQDGKYKDITLSMDSYWIKETFNQNYESIGRKCSADVIYKIADKLKTTLEYEKKSNYVNFNIDNSVYQIKASRVPIDELKKEEIGFKEDHYFCEIRQYESHQLEEIDLQNGFWELHSMNPQILIKNFFLNVDEKDSFISAVKENLPVEINWRKDDQLDEKVGLIFEGLYSDNLHIWFKSLAEAKIEYGNEADKILPIILRDLLFAKCETNHSEGKKILDDFLSNKYLFTIFRRLVLLCIDKHWNYYADLFDRFMKLIPSLLDDPEYEIELRDILLNHNKEFNDTLKSMIKEYINNVPRFYTERGEKDIAYWKYIWLSPLHDNPDFSALYEEAKKIFSPQDDKPYEPRRSTIQSGFIKPISPISAEEILQKPISELVKYLKDFEGTDERDFFSGKANKGGLAQTLRAFAKDNPKKFTDGLLEFCTVDHAYLQSIFIGLDEAWKTNKELDWNMIFNFALKFFGRDKKYILEESNIAQGEDSGKGKYIWIVDQITNLIAEGCRNDERAFDSQYFDKVESIFDLIFPLLKSGGYPDKDKQGNIINYAFNTTLGRTVQSYISFSLRVARALDKKKRLGYK